MLELRDCLRQFCYMSRRLMRAQSPALMPGHDGADSKPIEQLYQMHFTASKPRLS